MSISEISSSSTVPACFSIRASGPVHVIQLALQGKGERRDGAFHSLQHVNAEELDKTLLAIRLPEETLSPAEPGAVFFVVCFALVRQYIAQWRVGGEVQPTDFRVHLSNSVKFPGKIDIGA